MVMMVVMMVVIVTVVVTCAMQTVVRVRGYATYKAHGIT